MHSCARAHVLACLVLAVAIFGDDAPSSDHACSGSSQKMAEPGNCQPQSEKAEALPVSFLQHAHGIDMHAHGGMRQSATGGERKPDTRPNIIIFLPDDMYLTEYVPWLSGEYSHREASGIKDFAPVVPRTVPEPVRPTRDFGLMSNLAKIAQDGATFSRAYSTSSSCTPSRFSILTGRYASRSVFGRWATPLVFEDGTGDEDDGEQESYVYEGFSFVNGTDTTENLPSALLASGYATGMVGKWGLTPQTKGGDYDVPYSVHQERVKAAGFDYAEGVYIANQNTCVFPICREFSHNMEWLLESAMEFMDGALARRTPFFLYFNPTIPHSPPDSSDVLLGLFNSSQTPAGLLSRPPDISRYCSSCYNPPPSEIWAATENLIEDKEKRQKVASLYWVDISLGILHDYLSEKAAIDNTYLIITTDHGPAKGSLFELACRVPMYVAGPGIAPGTIIDELVSHLDIAPTVLAWSGLLRNGSMFDVDGLSWVSLVAGKASVLDRQEIFMETMFDRALVTRDGMKYYKRVEAAHVTGTDISKFAEQLAVAYPAFASKEQVYNLTTDITEQRNLISDGAYASEYEQLRLRMEAHRRATL